MDLLQFSLLDMTPYDKQSWFNLVGGYNQSLWPFNLLAVLFTLSVPLLIARGSARLGLLLLGVSWLWCGGVFHWQYFSNLNWAAPWFGWVFIVEGTLLILAALFLKQGAWISLSSPCAWLASFMVLLALVVYPLSGLLEERTLTQLEWFPLLPAPVTLVTVALLVLLNSRWRHLLVVIPLLWVVVSGAFASTLGLLELYFMVGTILLWFLHLINLVVHR
ncbi:DUF6064 family protein [Leucothrix arctica]|uniref:MFS transporter permease n=1 Tax=Leucothrix arctica TaxID=1481894 RepID=A0A317C4F8_9GAMM|nr:DUF6064 family protein [Leucothrix arctica]PWQ93169.1 hypothetical protein DKT75_21000 [Leucothrix arctica]